MMKRLMLVAACAVLALSGCDREPAPEPAQGRTITIVSGSENQSLFGIVEDFARAEGVDVKLLGLGSVDIMLDVQKGRDASADIVWPAASLWLELGDVHRVLRHSKSIMRSPVVFWVKKSVAQTLGWVDTPVTMDDIMAAVDDGLKFGMTSASQSNSGAMTYFAMLSAAAGRPEALTMADVQDREVKMRVGRLLRKVGRTAGSSGWLGALYLRVPDAMDAMFNYESVGIEINRELEKRGEEPLCAIYPADGVAIADSPLAYVDKGDTPEDQAIEAFFLKLQKHLLSHEVQVLLAGEGRRVGPGEGRLDATAARGDWCLDANQPAQVVEMPEQLVIETALHTYQGETRRPSEIVFLLDYSGGMEGEGNRQLVEAMSNLLVQVKAQGLYLEPTEQDVFHVVPFNNNPITVWNASGGSSASLESLFDEIRGHAPGGGADIYVAARKGMDILKHSRLRSSHSQMILLLTNGLSTGDFATLRQDLSPDPASNVPIFMVMFGAASRDQAEQIAQATAGGVFDGRDGLVQAFRSARSYAN